MKRYLNYATAPCVIYNRDQASEYKVLIHPRKIISVIKHPRLQ